MPKKTVILVVLALAWSGVACLCTPAALFPLQPEPVRTPTLQPQPPAALPTVAAEDLPACVLELDQTLYEAENAAPSGEELSHEYPLVTYTVAGDTLSDVLYPPVPPDVQEYQDAAGRQEIWSFITAVIPAAWRTQISRFGIFTDGAGGTLGAVEQADDPHSWRLEMDLVDAGSFPDLSTTLIHEFGHLVTLNDSQVIVDLGVFNNPDDEQIFEQERAACSTYFVAEGCSLPDSYLNAFYNLYWTELYDEWLAIDGEPEDAVYEDRLDAFYQEYAVQFVSSYAATSPTEDIAESFMYFIFSPKPAGLTIADQKVLFFYGYPELVDLRLGILERLCAYVELP